MRLTKKKATEFFKSILGHASGLEADDSGALPTYTMSVGINRYAIWIIDDRILCHIIFGTSSIGMYFFNFETFEYDWEFTECRMRD